MTDILYKNPPITEAVIGINFTSPLSEKELAAFNQKLGRIYPDQQVIPNVSFTFDINENNFTSPNTQTTTEDSYRLSRDNSTQITILTRAAFLLSQLAPYQGWDSISNRFAEAWAIKTRAIGFKEIARVGMRYINRIDIPLKDDVIVNEDYLNIYPYLPKSLGNMNAYAIQASLPLDKIACNLTINSAVVSSPIIGHLSFVIDIDISTVGNTPQSDDDIFKLLNEIRLEKNRVFEECITDNARKLFNHE